MNVIEEYVDQLQKFNISTSIFEPNGTQICPAEGTRYLNEFAVGLKPWFSYVDHIICTQLIYKNWKNEKADELQGVAVFDVYYKVKSGEAKVSAIQVINANQFGKIIYINSFWDLSHFKNLVNKHPELKQVFKSL